MELTPSLPNIINEAGYFMYIYGSIFGKMDLLTIFHVIKYDAECGTCL